MMDKHKDILIGCIGTSIFNLIIMSRRGMVLKDLNKIGFKMCEI